MKLIYLLPLFLVGCTKDLLTDSYKSPTCTIKQIPNIGELELVWQKPLTDDLKNAYSMDGAFILEKEVAFFYACSTNILFLDKKSGEITGRFNAAKSNLFDPQVNPEAGLVTYDHKSLYSGKSANDFKERYLFEEDLYPDSYFTLFANKAYFSMGDKCDKGAKAWIQSYDLSRYNVENILFKDASVEWGGDTVVHSDLPTIVTISGKNKMFCSYRKIWDNYWKSENFIESRDLENVKQITWKDNVLSIYGGSKSIVYENSVISNAEGGITRFDAENNKVIWRQTFIPTRPWKAWLSSNLILVGSEVFMLDQGHVVAIDVNTGEILFDSPEFYDDTNKLDLTYFDGVLYWTAHQDFVSWIFGFRVHDRKIVLKMKSPNFKKQPFDDDAIFPASGLKIDATTRMAYIHDNFFAQCFRIPMTYD